VHAAGAGWDGPRWPGPRDGPDGAGEQGAQPGAEGVAALPVAGVTAPAHDVTARRAVNVNGATS
jgi:hypothetical protein